MKVTTSALDVRDRMVVGSRSKSLSASCLAVFRIYTFYNRLSQSPLLVVWWSRLRCWLSRLRRSRSHAVRLVASPVILLNMHFPRGFARMLQIHVNPPQVDCQRINAALVPPPALPSPAPRRPSCKSLSSNRAK